MLSLEEISMLYQIIKDPEELYPCITAIEKVGRKNGNLPMADSFPIFSTDLKGRIVTPSLNPEKIL